MRRLAERLGIRAPSIYKHLPDKEALEDAVISTASRSWPGARASRPRAGWRPLRPPTGFSRKRHPHLYRLMTERPLRRDRLGPGSRSARPRR